MKEIKKEGICWCCGVPMSQCQEFKAPVYAVDREAFWTRVAQIFGDKGMPSCGMTDAGKLGVGHEAKTIYIGAKRGKV